MNSLRLTNEKHNTLIFCSIPVRLCVLIIPLTVGVLRFISPLPLYVSLLDLTLHPLTFFCLTKTYSVNHVPSFDLNATFFALVLHMSTLGVENLFLSTKNTFVFHMLEASETTLND